MPPPSDTEPTQQDNPGGRSSKKRPKRRSPQVFQSTDVDNAGTEQPGEEGPVPTAEVAPSPTPSPTQTLASPVQSVPVGSPPQTHAQPVQNWSASSRTQYSHSEHRGIAAPSITPQPYGASQAAPTAWGSPPTYLAARPSPPSRQSYTRRPSSGHSSTPYHTQAPFYDGFDPGRPGNTAQIGRGTTVDNQTFLALDTLHLAGEPSSSGFENVLLRSSEQRLDVFHVKRWKLDLIGRLEQLNGAVLSAKILPCTLQVDSLSDLRPLVALVIHGPTEDYDDPERSRISHIDERTGRSMRFQTRVEVRSLRTGEHVATLYKSPEVEFSDLSWPHERSLPAAVGSLSVEARGSFIAIASGSSGEVFVFALSTSPKSPSERFRCIGKFWTTITLQNPNSQTTPTTRTTLSPSEDDTRTKQIPLFSLSHRWLAIVPPSHSSRHSIQGSVPISPSEAKPTGVESITAPAPPSANTTLDTPDPEPLTNRLARGVAQEVIKGAKWVGAQGWQAWQNYWQTPSHGGPEETNPYNYREPQFPPTHAEERSAKFDDREHGSQVSIVDLKLLLNASSGKRRGSSVPLATFPAPSGCSFVSFAPSGLFLLTVTEKGDVQYVWDLISLRPGKATSKGGSATASEPSVRQVAKFSRFTNACVVDVVWSEPKGDKLAIITERGTIHTFQLPSSSFIWPPLKPLTPLAKPSSASKPSEPTSDAQDTSLRMTRANTLSSAAATVSAKAQPIVDKVRRGSSGGATGILSNFGNLNVSAAAGLKGGKTVAAGISKSFGAAAGQVNQLRRSSDSRFRLSIGARGVQSGRVRFLTGEERGSLGALSNSVLRHHTIVATSSSKAQSSSKLRDSELVLASEFDRNEAAGIGRWPSSRKKPRRTNGFWMPQVSGAEDSESNASTADVNAPSLHPLACAEIDSTAPFQPFHADRRITISVYKPPDPWEKDNPDASPWGFGVDIPTLPLHAETTTKTKAAPPPPRAPPATLREALALSSDDDADPEPVAAPAPSAAPVPGERDGENEGRHLHELEGSSMREGPPYPWEVEGADSGLLGDDTFAQAVVREDDLDADWDDHDNDHDPEAAAMDVEMDVDVDAAPAPPSSKQA